MKRSVRLSFVVATALVLSMPSAPAAAQSWPEVFDPLTLRTFELEIDPLDWDTIRFDLTNDIEVPAMFAADGETPLLVSVRRKSSRALPSEADPVKIGLKIDINEYVDDQDWHGLVKLSLENGGDVSVVQEGFAWLLHERASQAGFYGPEAHAALANWVRLEINGQYVGVYTSVEQRDKQFLRNRGVRVKDQTWLYEIDDIDSWALEDGDPHSPAFAALCYPPFGAGGGGRGRKGTGCKTPSDAVLEAILDGWIELDAMLAQGAVDAFADNPDALFSHGKNFSFADFDHDGLKRRYYPWDLDAVFRSTEGGIYGRPSKRRGVTQSPYQSILLNHPALRVRYNGILAAMVAAGGPLSEDGLHAALDALEPVLTAAILDDPYVTEHPAATFGALKAWISDRIPSVLAQIAADGPPPPR